MERKTVLSEFSEPLAHVKKTSTSMISKIEDQSQDSKNWTAKFWSFCSAKRCFFEQLWIKLNDGRIIYFRSPMYVQRNPSGSYKNKMNVPPSSKKAGNGLSTEKNQRSILQISGEATLEKNLPSEWGWMVSEIRIRKAWLTHQHSETEPEFAWITKWLKISSCLRLLKQ